MSFGTVENLVNAAPRKLGGKEVGPLAFGCWRLVGDDVADATQRIETALDNGLTLIDNADVYGLDWGGQAFGESETLLGKVLVADKTLRDRMVLASKGGIIPGIPYVASADYLNAAVDASLTRLQTEHIDLYQVHRPDMFAHPAETAAALDALVQAGKIGMVGISNYTQAQEDALRQFLKAPLVSLQSEYSLAALTIAGIQSRNPSRLSATFFDVATLKATLNLYDNSSSGAAVFPPVPFFFFPDVFVLSLIHI